MAAILKWHQNHRYLSSFITVWILAPFLLFWFVMLILLTQCFGWFSKMNFKNQNNKKGAKIQTVMKELKYLWFWCHSNMAAIGYLDVGFSNPHFNLCPSPKIEPILFHHFWQTRTDPDGFIYTLYQYCLRKILYQDFFRKTLYKDDFRTTLYQDGFRKTLYQDSFSKTLYRDAFGGTR